ncbi:MAG: AMP-binding protein, partial [Acetobacteraceae bacterium]
MDAGKYCRTCGACVEGRVHAAGSLGRGLRLGSALTDTVYAVFRDAADAWHDRPFLHVTGETARHYGIAPGTLTYGQAAAEVEAIAQRYRTAGYGVGHRVGLMLENQPATFLHWFALNGLGASVVPLNPDLRAGELDYLLRHSGICLAVGAPIHTDTLRNAVSRNAGSCSVAADEAEIATAPTRAHDQMPDAGTECALLYTS